MDVSLSELQELDREAWRAAIHGVAKSWTRLSDWTELNCPNFVPHTAFPSQVKETWRNNEFAALTMGPNQVGLLVNLESGTSKTGQCCPMVVESKR